MIARDRVETAFLENALALTHHRIIVKLLCRWSEVRSDRKKT